jgi:hypothetical protein
MPTTQLFVELLVVGMGVVSWIVLLVAAVVGLPLSPQAAALGPGELAAVTATAYVLGIMLDRIARTLWGAFLYRPERIHGTPTDDAERMICCKSERLWNTCAYNRSRFRICRAWTLNFALLALTYALWNASSQTHQWQHSAAIILVAIVLCVLAAWATVRLNRDYYVQIEGVFPLLPNCCGPLTTAEDRVQNGM